MPRTLLPASANLICQHWSHVLLIKRSKQTDTWPGYWAFPGGKIEDGELFRECAFRETREEVGLLGHPRALQWETIVMTRTIQWVKITYFWLIEYFENSPDILEPHLIDDMAWFPITELPEPMIPSHKIWLDALKRGIAYSELDVAP
jgi:ADP-ribose pyrophosphatase YjhB (NUDIX family)